MRAVYDDDLMASDVLADPYPLFRRLRQQAPIHYNKRWGGLVLLRHTDVITALSEPRLSADAFTPFRERLDAEDQDRFSMIFRILATGMVYKDPPEHTRLRALVNKAFTRAALERIRPRVQPMVDELLDAIVATGARHMDLVRDFASPLPIRVIAETIGVPTKKCELIKEWSDDIATLMLGAVEQSDRHERANRALAAMSEYLREIIAERSRRPGEDLVSALIAARDRQELLSEDELVAMCTLLVFAGHETTTNLIANSILALLQHPSELAKLRASLAGDGQLLTSAIEELLRYDGPMKAISRIAREPLQLCGQPVERGERVLLLLAAANRDPARFPEPEQLDLARTSSHAVAFGYGIHYCLGAALARLEAQTAIATLLRRFPTLRLAVPRESLQWHKALLVRGVCSLPLEF